MWYREYWKKLNDMFSAGLKNIQQCHILTGNKLDAVGTQMGISLSNHCNNWLFTVGCQNPLLYHQNF